MTNRLMTLLLLSLVAMPLAAQEGGEYRDVTLIELQSLPAEKRAVVFRRHTGEDRDVIGLAPNATPTDLAVAIRFLRSLQAKNEIATRDMAAAVKVGQEAPGRNEGLYRGFIQKVQRARPEAVRGFGTVKAFRIKVPRARTQ